MFTWQPKGGGGGFKPYCLRLSLRQCYRNILCGSGHNDGVFLCTLNFYLAAQGGGGLNPLNPPPPRRSATEKVILKLCYTLKDHFLESVGALEISFLGCGGAPQPYLLIYFLYLYRVAHSPIGGLPWALIENKFSNNIQTNNNTHYNSW